MISRELKAASSKPIILSILARRESYGYQILQDILELSGGKWEWSEAMLYPVLKRLSSEGLIQSRWEVQENGRKRKYYKLTEHGILALQEERAHWLNMHQSLNTLWSTLDESLIKG
ncbi:MAG: PadR family transcriptional regulator [Balneolaceae bacterium]